MEPAQVVDKLKSALNEAKQGGLTAVEIDSLEKFLEELRKDAGHSVETIKLEHQRNLALYDAQTKHGIEMFKSVIESGREALNALVLINGGAVVALLGFMGATVSKGLPAALGASLTWPLLHFGFGVLMGALAFGTRYLSQALFAIQKQRAGNVLNGIAITFAVSGYVLFGTGIYRAFIAFAKQFAV
jgi:hypothetical protein